MSMRNDPVRLAKRIARIKETIIKIEHQIDTEGRYVEHPESRGISDQTQTLVVRKAFTEDRVETIADMKDMLAKLEARLEAVKK